MPVTANYTPRHPEDSLLYRVVAGNLESFLAAQQARDRAVPSFVEEEFRSYLKCGQLEFGFLLLYCDTCRKDRLLPFSCKGGRAFCPSCGARRMADTAAHLVDRVIPAVPVRQWVLSLPYALRFRVAFDAGLLREVLAILVHEVFGSLRRRAREYGIPNGKCGSVSFEPGAAFPHNVSSATLRLVHFKTAAYPAYPSTDQLTATTSSPPVTTISQTTTTQPLPTAYHIVGGLEWRFPAFSILPQFRYSRWTADTSGELIANKPNQVEVLLGFTLHPFKSR
jgi:hypothetical protein